MEVALFGKCTGQTLFGAAPKLHHICNGFVQSSCCDACDLYLFSIGSVLVYLLLAGTILVLHWHSCRAALFCYGTASVPVLYWPCAALALCCTGVVVELNCACSGLALGSVPLPR